MSAEKPAPRARRKRARVEEADDAQASSSSSSSSSSEREGAVDAMAVVDGADERPLLVENCAADRAKLTTQKHDLVVAETDLKSL